MEMFNLDMSNTFLYILLFFVVINIFSFLMMWIDKKKSAKRGAERISEGMLFFMAVSFGSMGVYGGMFTFRHKTQKWYFIIGMPLVILQNISFLWAIYSMLT
jgi:uncharacterized membrane protein YsdA (DUF1294 family)